MCSSGLTLHSCSSAVQELHPAMRMRLDLCIERLREPEDNDGEERHHIVSALGSLLSAALRCLATVSPFTSSPNSYVVDFTSSISL